jgi:hypothetical protein
MALTKVSYSLINGAPVNVLDFGAIGDGVTNDTAAIQAAVNSTADGTVYLPPGTYLVDSIVFPYDTRGFNFVGASMETTILLMNDPTRPVNNYNQEMIQNSRLPEAIKQAMLAHPIPQTTMNHTFSLDDVSDLIDEKPMPAPQSRRNVVNEQTTNHTNNSNMVTIDKSELRDVIKDVLIEANIEFKKKGNQSKNNYLELTDNYKLITFESETGEYIATCKQTGKVFKDANNYSGALTAHLKTLHPEIEIPANTYLNKRYEIEHGKKWYADYFDIQEVDKKETKKCP